MFFIPPGGFTFRADSNIALSRIPFMAAAETLKLFFYPYFHNVSLPLRFTVVKIYLECLRIFLHEFGRVKNLGQATKRKLFGLRVGNVRGDHPENLISPCEQLVLVGSE